MVDIQDNSGSADTPAADNNPSIDGTTPSVEASPRRTWSIVAVIAALIVAVLAGGVGLYLFLNKTSNNEDVVEDNIIRIGLSLDSVKIQRWADERDIMVEKAKEYGATVTTFSAESDDPTQIAQIENLISQDVDVIIVVAHDAEAVAPALTKAQEAGIKVINYDRLTFNGVPDLYLSFDSVKVGQYASEYVIDAIPDDIEVPNVAYVAGSQTDNNTFLVSEGVMGVLQPLIDEGKITLVFNEFTKDWSPSEAYLNFKAFLDGGGEVDAVITAYDGLAYGVIQALTEYGLEGTVPVSGQNGELQAIQRINQGTQTMTAYKPGRPLAEKAVEAAVAYARGEEPETNSSIDNGTAEIASYLFDPIPVTKENILETVVADGTFTEGQVFAAPVSTP